jgi:hypothetical protein
MRLVKGFVLKNGILLKKNMIYIGLPRDVKEERVL